MSITDTITNTTKSLPDWSLNTLKSGNDAILTATKKMVEAFEPAATLVPKTSLAERLPDVPQPTEFLTVWFGYVEKLVAEQKRFGLDLAGVVSPTPEATTPTRKTSAAKSA